jgi:hypothetical protein
MFNVGPSPDVLAFDASKRWLYVSEKSGIVAVFAETATSARPVGLSCFLQPRRRRGTAVVHSGAIPSSRSATRSSGRPVRTPPAPAVGERTEEEATRAVCP